MGIFVWGTGCGASELIEKGLNPDRISGFVDSYPPGDSFLGRPVYLPGAFPAQECSLMLVTTRQVEAVAEKCRQLGLPAEKLLFVKNAHVLTDRNAGCSAASELDEELLDRILVRQRGIPVPGYLSAPVLSERDLENDYVRVSTLELLCRRLEAVPGAAAELGVYRGAFARCINQLLPERKLYLFDSFEGFAPSDGAPDAFHQAHQNTSAERVLANMPHRERVIVKPGFFPASLMGLEERFCLVSVDVDFEESTLAGLRYFWPRLNSGGYLLLHDWNDRKLRGVSRALEAYEKEWGCAIAAVPLCDAGGTLVLCKQVCAK